MEIRMELLTGCVGDGAAIEFASWLANMDLPDPRECRKDPKKYYRKPKQDEEHRVHAILSAVLATVREDKTVPMW
jgi:hypothetical protein